MSIYIRDKETSEHLSGAHVFFSSINTWHKSGQNGELSIEIPPDTYDITASFVGYISKTIILNANTDTTCYIDLIQTNILPDITVYGQKNNFGIRGAQMSAIELPIAKIKQIPALMGETDVLKAIQKLPGVQTSNDGHAGIYVRGGGYDQNQITMDGATLYNAEHLKGFISAINPDMVDNLSFYKGAFPARYGGQLSSIVDIGIRQGDMSNYRGELSIGALSSKIQLEGPIIKGKTSFNIASRFSYLNFIVQPILHSIADNNNAGSPYADLSYFDITAKLVHKLSHREDLSLFLYSGKDKSDESPTIGRHSSTDILLKQPELESSLPSTTTTIYTKESTGGTINNWSNHALSLTWRKTHSKTTEFNGALTYSNYLYYLKKHEHLSNFTHKNTIQGINIYDLQQYKWQDSHKENTSSIEEYSLKANTKTICSKNHNITGGIKLSFQKFRPRIGTYLHKYSQESSYYGTNEPEHTFTGPVTDYLLDTSSTLKGIDNLYTTALYIEDETSINKNIHTNLGLRCVLFIIGKKNYISLEPRISLNWLLNDNTSLKLSYARMAQGIHLLSSSNLMSPSDIWIPISKDTPPMISDQFAIGYNQQLPQKLMFSIEGYYKTMNNMLEYNEGVSFYAPGSSWDNMLSHGKGKSYGIEFYLQKDLGKTTGWISYTWSRSTMLFDNSGEELNGGKSFYSGTDRRHNCSIVFNHKFSTKCDLSLSWTYQSGRKGNLTSSVILGGIQGEYSAYNFWPGASDLSVSTSFAYNILDKAFGGFAPLYTSGARNSFELPPTHRLDIGVNFHIQHKIKEKTAKSSFNISVYNAYNRKNISSLYWGYHKNQNSNAGRLVLKGVCLLPIMPSISYTLKM